MTAVVTVATMDTPAGPFTVLAADGAVLASGWTTDASTLAALVAPALRPTRWTHQTYLGPITEAVAAYLDGDVGAIDAVVVRQVSAPFTEAVWSALRTVPGGAPITYRALAARSGRPAAIRAAGTACGRNPAALFVPCHRAQRGDGGLGGLRVGLDRQALAARPRGPSRPVGVRWAACGAWRRRCGSPR